MGKYGDKGRCITMCTLWVYTAIFVTVLTVKGICPICPYPGRAKITAGVILQSRAKGTCRICWYRSALVSPNRAVLATSRANCADS